MVGLRAFITGENVFTLSNYSGVDPGGCQHREWAG